MQNSTVICPRCQQYSTLDYRRTPRGSLFFYGGICGTIFFGLVFLLTASNPFMAVVGGVGFLAGVTAICLGNRKRDWHCKACGSGLGLADEELHSLQDRARDAMEQEAAKIILGQVPPPSVSCLLERDERALIRESCALLEERVISRQYVGGSKGVNFRVAKGVSFRVGAHRGHIETERGTVPVSQGDLVITTKRVIFTGHPKSLVIKFGKIASVEGEGCMLAINESGKPNLRAFKLDRPIARLPEILIRNANQNLGN